MIGTIKKFVLNDSSNDTFGERESSLFCIEYGAEFVIKISFNNILLKC